MVVWIVNPFDELPDEAGRPMRYANLCDALDENGIKVVWWSSAFSHRRKVVRDELLREVNGYQIRLIPVPPYRRNVSLARIRNHRLFGKRFEQMALRGLGDQTLAKPDCIIASTPPLEGAWRALRLGKQIGCKVIVDIQDAWPETFLRLIPKQLRWADFLGRVVLSPWFSIARRVYHTADYLTACAQCYLDLTRSYGATAPHSLIYHGTGVEKEIKPRNLPMPFTRERPFRLIYLGAMGRSYDLQTAIRVVAALAGEQRYVDFQLIGEVPAKGQLRQLAHDLGVLRDLADANGGVRFWGYLKGEMLQEKLREADVGLIPMDPESLVGVPNKLVDYCAVGLPVLSCLGGESGELLKQYQAGWHYSYKDKASLKASLVKIMEAPALLAGGSSGAAQLAREWFDGRGNALKMVEVVRQVVGG